MTAGIGATTYNNCDCIDDALTDASIGLTDYKAEEKKSHGFIKSGSNKSSNTRQDWYLNQRFTKPKNEEDSLSHLSLYKNALERFPPLGREEEEELGRRLKQARSNKDAERYRELRQKLITSNLKFVIYIAEREGYFRKGSIYGLSYMDIIQAGNTGLVIASDKWDVDTGNKYISYAVWQVMAEMDNLIKKRYLQGVSGMNRKFIERIKNAANCLRNSLGREPMSREIAVYYLTRYHHPNSSNKRLEIGYISEGHFAQALVDRTEKMIIDKFETLKEFVSLDANVHSHDGESENSLLEMIKDETESPEEMVIEKLMHEKMREIVWAAVDLLPERKRGIIKKRFPKKGEQETYREIACKAHVTKQAIQDAEKKALRDLRLGPYGEQLEELLYVFE